MKNILLSLLSLLSINTASAQFPEGFESLSFPPEGWAVFNGANGLGTNYVWALSANAASGIRSAYIRNEFLENESDVAQDWLVTPAVAITSENSVLSFQQAQQFFSEYNSNYTVRVSTSSQTMHSSFAIVDSQVESQMGVGFIIRSVDLSAFIGQTIYVAFVFENNGGDAWYIDDVAFGSPTSLPSCPVASYPINNATSVAINANNENSVEIGWTPPASGDPVLEYQIFFGQDPQSLEFLGTTSDLTYTIPFSYNNTTYYWNIKSIGTTGTSQNCPVQMFTTIAENSLIPEYFTNFQLQFSDGWKRAVGNISAPLVRVEQNNWGYFQFGNQIGGTNGIAANINVIGQDSDIADWFLSPLFDLGAAQYELSFDIALTGYDSTASSALTGNDYIAFLVTENDGVTWQEVQRWDQSTPISNAGQSVSVTGLTQSSIARFAFYAFIEANSTANSDFFVDNFRIFETVLSVNEPQANKLQYYPNPVSNVLHFSKYDTIQSVSIFNMLGQKIPKVRYNLNDGSIDMSALSSGYYIARVQSDNGVQSIKIIKQ